jgi:hypothetical protein
LPGRGIGNVDSPVEGGGEVKNKRKMKTEFNKILKEMKK